MRKFELLVQIFLGVGLLLAIVYLLLITYIYPWYKSNYPTEFEKSFSSLCRDFDQKPISQLAELSRIQPVRECGTMNDYNVKILPTCKIKEEVLLELEQGTVDAILLTHESILSGYRCEISLDNGTIKTTAFFYDL